MFAGKFGQQYFETSFSYIVIQILSESEIAGVQNNLKWRKEPINQIPPWSSSTTQRAASSML
jgi:hypothetical protein